MSSQDEGDMEQLRKKNEIQRRAFLASVMDDPVFSDTVKQMNIAAKQQKNTVFKSTTKRKQGDSNFRFKGYIPAEKRKSERLLNKKPKYTYLDLPDETTISRESNSLEDMEDMEKIVYEVKKTRKTTRLTAAPKIIPVEEVTEEMINNVFLSGNKVYGPMGTSCHQCRQKTVDTKTICRSGECVGGRGQYCGICVVNRYGEDPVAALKDPAWKCYVCRGCCNCSFCRAKKGKRPTGILAPLAKTNGYKSVQDLLASLNGLGDYPELNEDPEALLGFEGNKAVLRKDRPQVYAAKHPENLLGFDGNIAVMVGGKEEFVPYLHQSVLDSGNDVHIENKINN